MGLTNAVDGERLFEQAQEALTGLRPARAERLLHKSIAALEAARELGEPSGLAPERVMVSLAYVRAERGHSLEGQTILDAVEHRIAHWPEASRVDLEGLLASQRALLRVRTGDLRGGLEQFNYAVPRLSRSPEELLRALGNRGAICLYLGMLEDARADFAAVAVVAADLGKPIDALKATHNLGYLEFLRGNLPLALSYMDDVADGFAGLGPGPLAVVHLDRARVRYAAGLLAEADADLEISARSFAAQGNRQDQAECELARAQVALSAGDDVRALSHSRSARQRFQRRGSTAWALVARLTELRAMLALGLKRRNVAVDAQALALELARVELLEDARMAELVAVRAYASVGLTSRAHELTRSGPPKRAGAAIVTALYQYRAVADLAAADGDPVSMTRALKAGLRELHRYQSSFGSLDLQTAVVRHGRALAAQGLAAAVAGGRPAQVFTWSETARGMASRLPPVRPPEDPEAARLLEELRYVRTEQRTAELSGRDDPSLRTRRGELERLVRQRSWYAPGPGDVEEPATLAQLREALSATPGATLVAHMVVGTQVHALVVSPRRSHVVALGPVDAVLQRIRRIRADLDALAVRGMPEPIRRSVNGSVTRGLTALQAQLWDPMSTWVAQGPLLLVPSGALVAAPWPLLPALRGRPVALARSATAWLRAQDAVSPLADDARVVAAAGPDLARAEEEVEQISLIWQHCQSFTGDAARGDALLAAADGADVVHVAAHGVHEAANPLFAALRLADGPLFGYDLARLKVAPRLVVLSACELGQVSERPGDEVIGMTAALLHQGVGTVVSAISKVSDDVACDVTAVFHAQLRAGYPPAVALARATESVEEYASFVAFGRGW